MLDYLAAAVVVAICTLISGLSHWWDLAEANIVMIFLAGVALTAARFGHGPALAAIGLSVVSYDFFFVPPVFAFAMVETQYVITLGVMVAIGLLISELTSRLREQLHASQLQERRNALLYQMTREFGSVTHEGALVNTAGMAAANAFDGEALLYLRDAEGNLVLRFGQGTAMAADPELNAAVRWTAYHEEMAGRGGEGAPTVAATLAPMAGLARDDRRLMRTAAEFGSLSGRRRTADAAGVREPHRAVARTRSIDHAGAQGPASGGNGAAAEFAADVDLARPENAPGDDCGHHVGIARRSARADVG